MVVVASLAMELGILRELVCEFLWIARLQRRFLTEECRVESSEVAHCVYFVCLRAQGALGNRKLKFKGAQRVGKLPQR